MIKKYKREIILFLILFLIYFILGNILSYFLDTSKYWNVLFDLDTPRVLGDLSLREYNHYRTSVHPLFVIIFQPIVYILKNIIGNPILAIILIQSILSATSSLIFYKILGKMDLSDKAKKIFLLIFALSFGQIVFSSAIETYIYAQAFLIPLWLFVLVKIDKSFKTFDYIILIFLGVGSIAVTITNFFQFIIAVFFLIFINKKINKKFIASLLIVFITIAISVFLANIQNILWTSAPNFFTKGINDLMFGNSEEKRYIASTFSIQNIKNVLNSNFSYSFNVSGLFFPENAYLVFKNTLFSDIFSILSGILFLIFNFYFIIKTKFNIRDNKFYYAMLISYVFNFVLHLYYGNSIAFMYICHYNFLIILIIAYIYSNLKMQIINNKYIYISLIFVTLILCVKNVLSMFMIFFPMYNRIEYVKIFPLIIILVSLILLIFLIFKNKYIKISLLILFFLITLFSWKIINPTITNCKDQKCGLFEKYERSLEKYKGQLKDMKNEFNVRYYIDRDEPVGIYYFGMANRTKILYKDGKLINIKTKEVLKNIDYKKELIVPNEYSVLLEDKLGNLYRIYEDETGIYISKNDDIETIFKSKETINLPEFEKNKYSEILKVVHQEVLFNIDGYTPKPNLITYADAWYRDALLATKVLESTKNLNLIAKWVSKIDSIYDYQRDPSIKEADNLGALLYIIGVTGVKRDDLVKKIVVEINRIKQPNGSIRGMVDGLEQSYYPTALAVHASKRIGIDLGLVVPMNDDGYAKLTWYYENPPQQFYSTIDSRYYPYIDWAFYHYDLSGKLYILDEIYPLSYEGGSETGNNKVESECFVSEYYCSKGLFLSHIWHASEMYLFLIQY